MTWSIIARDKANGAFGIAAASKFFALGSRVPHLASGVGAVATQALLNGFYGTQGLARLRAGKSADEVVRSLVAEDAGRAHRQVHLMDAHGRTACHTGDACIGWCGHVAREGFSTAGNMLTGAVVLDATATAYAAGAALPFPRRLIAAMRAGEAAGGDKRGKQSAVLVVCSTEDWPDLDLRVDDHADPLAELERLERVSRERFVPFMRFLPRRADPVGVVDRDVIEQGVAKSLAAEQP
jgi:uncharacterized Ntn-hydrolase superfamily protein